MCKTSNLNFSNFFFKNFGLKKTPKQDNYIFFFNSFMMCYLASI